MRATPVQALARRVGIDIHWRDTFGQIQQVSEHNLHRLLTTLGYQTHSAAHLHQGLAALEHNAARLPQRLVCWTKEALCLGPHYAPGSAYQIHLENGQRDSGRLDHRGMLRVIPSGHHQLEIGQDCIDLSVAPSHCPSLSELTGHPQPRSWGLSAQLYALRRAGDGGIGDSLALSQLAFQAARRGADALLCSPVHAMPQGADKSPSPYSPSSRLFLNPVYAAPSQVLGPALAHQAVERAGLTDRMAQLESSSYVPWQTAETLRDTLLREIFILFRHSDHPLRSLFSHFEARPDRSLLRYCRFAALQAHFVDQGLGDDWRAWPVEYRHPDSAAVLRFSCQHAEDVRFQYFLQWLTQHCLEHSQTQAQRSGMAVGLINDLAVGVVPGGSDTWAHRGDFLPGFTVGAPPDHLNGNGQAWGLAAFSPWRLAASGFDGFIELLKRNSQWPGGLRIDHVMGLQRLWLIPEGGTPDQGAYVKFPLGPMLKLLCLEASRQRALIIGEDLGSVPSGLRPQLLQRGLLCTQVLLFQQHQGRFIAPAAWSDSALATTSTHDLPTLKGWFLQRDIDWRLRAGHSSAAQAEAERRQRRRESSALKRSLSQVGLAKEHDTLDNCLKFIAATPSPLVLLPLEDLVGSDEQANLPGPEGSHPNWRRRWPVPATDLLGQAQVQRRLQGFLHHRHTTENPR